MGMTKNYLSLQNCAPRPFLEMRSTFRSLRAILRRSGFSESRISKVARNSGICANFLEILFLQKLRDQIKVVRVFSTRFHSVWKWSKSRIKSLQAKFAFLNGQKIIRKMPKKVNLKLVKKCYQTGQFYTRQIFVENVGKSKILMRHFKSNFQTLWF